MSKVDKIDLDKVIDMKSNRSDTEQAMKAIDILHKQVTHIIVLFIELIKIQVGSGGVPN